MIYIIQNWGNNMIAGVNDLGMGAWVPDEVRNDKEYVFYEFNKLTSNYLKQTLKIKDPKEYINAGVILFNIKECLNNDFLNSCLNVFNTIKNPVFVDQDLINIVCNGKIKYLDYRYNFFPSVLDWKDVEKYIPEYILNDIKILHFAGQQPWRTYNFNSESTLKWFKIYKRSPFFEYNKKEIFKLKLSLIRYKISKLIFRSKKRLNKYKTKIKNTENRIERIEFIEKQLI